jgi:hypothetical protein
MEGHLVTMKDAALSLAKALKVNPIVTAAIILLAACCVTSWRAAVAFTRLSRAVEQSWSYNMERESWDKFARLNAQIQIPDVEKIRKEHISASEKTDDLFEFLGQAGK